MDATCRQSSLLVEDIATDNLVIDTNLVFDKGNVLNVQDTLFSHSFLAIPETKLLNNQYLHDKISINIKRKKPSQKNQGASESSGNENPNIDEILDTSLVPTDIAENKDFKDEPSTSLSPLEETHLKTSVREDAVDFEDSFKCHMNASKESGKNISDESVNNSLLAIPETVLLSNNYLHDKIACNIKRKKPSRGIQGKLASTENHDKILDTPLVPTDIAENKDFKDEPLTNLSTLEETHLKTSVREDAVDFEDSFKCHMNASKESGKNISDEIVNNSLLAIPETVLLSNNYLHDKIACNIKRKKPSRGIQGMLASTENHDKDGLLLSINMSDHSLLEAQDSLTNGSIKINTSIASLPNMEIDTSVAQKSFPAELIVVDDGCQNVALEAEVNISNEHDSIKRNSCTTESDLTEKYLIDEDTNVLGLSMHAISMPNLGAPLETHYKVKSPKHGLLKVFKKNKKAQKLSKSTYQLSGDYLEKSNVGSENVGLSSLVIDENGFSKISGIECDVSEEAAHWDVHQVASFLTEIGYSQYVSSFQHHNVNGHVFISINKNYLKEIGVSNKEHRHQILKKVKELRDTSAHCSINKTKDKTKESKGKIWFWKK